MNIYPGARFKITRIEPDPDAAAVIHYEGGFAFPCGSAWLAKNKPTIGSFVVMGANMHWYVEPATTPDNQA